MSTALAHVHFTDNVQLPHKKDCYTYHVQTFRTWCATFGHSDELQAVPAYFRALNQSGYRAGTIRMKMSAIKNRLRLMADTAGLSMEENYRFEQTLKRLNTDPETRPPKTQSAAVSTVKVLTADEYNRVLLMAGSVKQQLFARFLWETGCRVSEMTGALLSRCEDYGTGIAITVMGKGRKERTVRIPAGLYRDILEHFRGEEYLFETAGGKPYRRGYITEQLRRLTKRATGRALGAHCFRHSFATRTIARVGTEKITAVSAYLGHSSPTTTLKYYVHSQLTDDDLFGAD